jgi:LysR family nitrogen assimilation transcriptional regulator
VNLAVLLDDGQLASFATTPLVEEELRFICRADAPWAAGRDSLPLAEALDATLILPGLQHGVRPRIESTARAAGLHTRDVIEINSIAILKSAILAGMGATILPVAPLQDDVERGAMRALAIRAPAISRRVVLCTSRNIPLTNAAAATGRLVGEVARTLCADGAWIGAHAL